MPTPDKNKAALEALIAKANAATGGDAATVTDAVDTLITGFGQDGGDDALDYARGIPKYETVDFGGNLDLVVEFGAKNLVAPVIHAFNSSFHNAIGVRSIKIVYRGGSGTLVNFDTCFQSQAGEYELRTIDLSGVLDRNGVYALANAFNGRRGLTTILGELDLSNGGNQNNAFRRCEALETVRFKSGTIKVAISFADCPILSNDTIQSIIDGLADLTGGTAQTLSLHADVGAKLTDAQKAAASAKNWTLAY